MERIKNYLINFMRGRYGIDQMSQTLFIAALIFILFAGFTQNFLFEMIGIALFAYADYRALSKNIPARRAENARYQEMIRNIKEKIRRGFPFFCIRNRSRSPRLQGCISARIGMLLPLRRMCVPRYCCSLMSVDSRMLIRASSTTVRFGASGFLIFSNSKFAAVSPIRSRGWATELSCGSVSRADCDSEKPITAICSGMR